MKLDRQNWTDVGLGVVLVAFAAWAWWQANTTIPRGMRTDPLGPAAVPQLLAIAIGVLAAALALSRLVLNGWLKPTSVGEDEAFEAESGGTFSWVRFGGFSALSTAYLALLEPVGYLIVTPLYAAGVLLLLGVRNWLVGVLAILVMVATLYVLFQIGLNVPLPRGILEGS